MSGEKILVIKHGALGDFVLALGPAKAIREHHASAHIVLLTTAPFQDLARASGSFDEIWLDQRASLLELRENLALLHRLRLGDFNRVYDLQTSSRTNRYFYFFPRRPRPEWSGIAAGCSHFQDNPDRGQLHTVERQRDQLRVAGIENVPLTDLSWAEPDLSRFELKAPFALLVPGGSAHRLEKRWPVDHYGDLAAKLLARGILPVVIGAAGEAGLGARICSLAPASRDLTGRTDFQEIAAIARGAWAGVGNDTGPSHIAALAGAPFLTLFSEQSDPARCAPRGCAVRALQQAALKDLPVDRVLRELDELTAAHPAEDML